MVIRFLALGYTRDLLVVKVQQCIQSIPLVLVFDSDILGCGSRVGLPVKCGW